MKSLAAAAIALAVLPSLCGVAPAKALSEGYVGCSWGDNCITFDLTTYALGDTIDLLPEGDYPYDATMTPDGTEVWICGASGDGVVVIDRATNVVTHRIPVLDYPNSVVFTDDGSLALVSARDGDLVTLIDTGTYSATGTLDATTGSGGTYDGPGNMALDPVSGNIYAADWYGDTIYEIAPDASSVLRTADVGNVLWQLVVDPFGTYVYATDRSDDVVRVIDRSTLTEVRTVPVGDDPWGIDVTLDGSKLVVACEDDSDVYIINTEDWTTSIVALDSGADPRDVDILDSEGYAYVPSGDVTGTDHVYVIEIATSSLKWTFDVPGGSNPNVIAVQPQTTSAMTDVADAGTGRLLVLDCFPNPFNPKTTIRYVLPSAGNVDLAIYDAAGHHVATVDSGERCAGEHEVFWGGTDPAGHVVAAGVYFVRLAASGTSTRTKAVLVK